jgi:hypothetical protein
MKAPNLSTADVLEDVLGALAGWLPGYDDRSPQSRITLVSEDAAGAQVYRYEAASGTLRPSPASIV